MELDYNCLNKIKYDMIREINLQNIVNRVEESTSDNLKKRNKKKREWCKENDKHFIKTFIVKTSYEERLIGNKKGKESMVLVPFASDDDIIETIKKNEPNDIQKTIHWFMDSYLFITDNDIIYNIHSKSRPLTTEEKEKVSKWREAVKKEESEVAEMKKTADILKRGYRDGDLSVLNDPKNLHLFLEFTDGNQKFKEGLKANQEIQELIAEHGEDKFNELVELNPDYYNDLFNKIDNISSKNNKVWSFLETVQARIQTLDELRNEVTKNIRAIYNKCNNEPLYEIHKMNYKNQVRIYIKKGDIEEITQKGYKVYKIKLKKEQKKWNDFNLDYSYEDYEKLSYYFIMNKKAFISCCKFGRLIQNGFYYNENGEITVIEKGKQTDNSITISIDGIPNYFKSLREAAKNLNIHLEVLRRCEKDNDGLILFCSKTGLSLVDDEGKSLWFKNKSELSKSLNIDKMKISRIFKNKQIGDKVTIQGNEYTIISL